MNRRTISRNHWTTSQSDSWLVLQAPAGLAGRTVPCTLDSTPVKFSMCQLRISKKPCQNGFAQNMGLSLSVCALDSAQKSTVGFASPGGTCRTNNNLYFGLTPVRYRCISMLPWMESSRCGCTGEANQIIGLSLSVEFGNPVVLF